MYVGLDLKRTGLKEVVLSADATEQRQFASILFLDRPDVHRFGLYGVQHLNSQIDQFSQEGGDGAVGMQERMEASFPDMLEDSSEMRFHEASPHSWRDEQIVLPAIVVAQGKSIDAYLGIRQAVDNRQIENRNVLKEFVDKGRVIGTYPPSTAPSHAGNGRAQRDLRALPEERFPDSVDGSGAGDL